MEEEENKVKKHSINTAGKRSISVAEAGKKGGDRTKEVHGHEFYHEIGKMGGAKRAKEIREEGISPEMHEKLSDAGHKGGEATKKSHGSEFYREIGRKGGTVSHKVMFIPEGEVIVKCEGKDLDITFSNQEEAEEWRNLFASMLQQEGYNFTRKKHEND